MTQHQEIMSKLDKIDLKLDNHLERITKVEEKIEGQKGLVRTCLALVGTLVAAIVTVAVKAFWK
jgi:hypothetical protein